MIGLDSVEPKLTTICKTIYAQILSESRMREEVRVGESGVTEKKTKIWSNFHLTKQKERSYKIDLQEALIKYRKYSDLSITEVFVFLSICSLCPKFCSVPLIAAIVENGGEGLLKYFCCKTWFEIR
jgi:hypothetical protein